METEEPSNGDLAMDEGAIVLRDNIEDESDGTSLNREAEEENNGEDEDEKQKTEKVDEDEEMIGRYECEIEEDVADFVDEKFRERHTIPESSDEEEEDVFVVKNRKMEKKGFRLALGTEFYTGSQFKEAVLDYALSKCVKRNHCFD